MAPSSLSSFLRATTPARFVAVEGDSMRPALTAGDRVLVLPLRPRVGDVIALRDPRARERTIVKRVAAITGRAIDVRGDNASSSTDSRAFGAVDRSLVLGRVVYRYAPAHRTGWIQRARVDPHR